MTPTPDAHDRSHVDVKRTIVPTDDTAREEAERRWPEYERDDYQTERAGGFVEGAAWRAEHPVVSDDTAALIAEAREAADYLDAFDEARRNGEPFPPVPGILLKRDLLEEATGHKDGGVQGTLRAIAAALEAARPAPASEDERNAAILLIRDGAWGDGVGWNLSGALAAQIADQFLAAGFRRSVPATVEVVAREFARIASDWIDTCDEDGHEFDHANWMAYVDDAKAFLARFTLPVVPTVTEESTHDSR